MRSWTRAVAAAAALAVAGCGNYSTEDLVFLAALPQREDLQFKVPAPNQQNALGACATRESKLWLEAKPTSDDINEGVAFLASLVDLVRRQPPTARTEDARRWGPFDDGSHPGHEIQVLIARTYPTDLGGRPRFLYWFQARWKGTPDFTSIMTGAFDGGSASRGRGWMVVAFDAIWSLGMQDETTPDKTTPHGTMQVAYDRASDPVTIQLVLSAGGFGAVDAAYRYAGYAQGGGVFDFAFREVSTGNLYGISAGFDAAGAGRLQAGFRTPGGFTGGFQECWGAGACLVYVNDPFNYSCDLPSCSLGVPADCPAVPASPF